MVLAYAYQKFDVWIAKKDVDIMASLNEGVFDESYEFTHEQGFAVAVAFTAYDSNPEPILDKAIGELVFEHYTWGTDEDGKYYTSMNRIPSHTCTRQELGLEEGSEKSTFLPIKPSHKTDVSFYQRKFMCIDPDEYKINGDYNSASARLMKVSLVKCHGHDYCKSESEITSFFRNKFLLILYSQVRFDATTYGAESIVPETIAKWL